LTEGKTALIKDFKKNCKTIQGNMDIFDQVKKRSSYLNYAISGKES
jgi:hypothetical protein